MIKVASLWRHPIKSHGRERIDSVVLEAGKTMPWDRHWAVRHEDSKFDADAPDWVMCRNFMIGVLTPGLAGIWAKLDADAKTLTLRHERLGALSFWPDEPSDLQRFLDWIAPICPADQRQPVGFAQVGDRGMTDTDYPTVSIMTHASHHAVEGMLGHPLEQERWRGNFWLNGPAAWDELDWCGKRLRIGEAVLEVVEPIQRCKHTMANPTTGQRDADTLAALNDGFGHQDFGVYAKVIEGGQINTNDMAEVL